MKKCTTCLDEKSLADFQVRRASPDGLTHSCKSCLRLRDLLRYEKEKPKRIEAMKRYQQSDRGKDSHTEAVKKWQEKHANRRAANVLLGNAIKYGRVIPFEFCQVFGCTETKVEGHHPDYGQPLSVVWLCNKHHRECHKTIK